MGGFLTGGGGRTALFCPHLLRRERREDIFGIVP